MQFSTLPSKVVDMIFERIPLRDLVPLRLVCNGWKKVVEKMCANKWSLTLFGCHSDLQDYMQDLSIYNLRDDAQFWLGLSSDNDVLIFPGGALDSDESYRFLAHLFPNIQKMIISFQHYHINLSWLLSRMATNLNWLALFNLYQFGKTRKASFWAQLNKMPLQCLHLFFVERLPIPVTDISRTLSKLVNFSLVDYHLNVGPVLKALGPNLTHLRLNEVNYGQRMRANELFTNNDPNFKLKKMIKLTNLSLDNIKCSSTETDLELFEMQLVCGNICTNLPSLEYFDPEFSSKLSLLQQFEYLSKLSNLQTLRLHIVSTHFGQIAKPSLFSKRNFVMPFVRVFKLKIHQDFMIGNLLPEDSNEDAQSYVNISDKSFLVKVLPKWINIVFPKLEQLFLETPCEELFNQLKEMDSSTLNLFNFKISLL